MGENGPNHEHGPINDHTNEGMDDNLFFGPLGNPGVGPGMTFQADVDEF